MRLVALLAIVVALVSIPGVAAACGAFAGPPAPTEAELIAKLPYLTVEQVLVVWDKDTQMEDFVREARFAKSNQAFGFVVPTPTKPEVAAVKDPPWDRLHAKVPFQDMSLGGGGGDGTKGGPPMAAAAVPPPVEVLSQTRIGSFTAFTLATTDAGAFDKWLKDNGFTMTKESKPWIEHYVRLKFFFVAFRYEPSDAGSDLTGRGEMTSESVRIRFKTPNPYYPYMEPEHAAGAPKATTRRLDGWFVTKEPMVPVVARPTSRPRFGRPWELGMPAQRTSAELATILGDGLKEIVPQSATPLSVQAFRDQKVSRSRYGDVLLVPQNAATFSQADIDSRRFLLGVIDPVVIGEQDKEPVPEDAVSFAPISTSVPATNKPSTCSATPGPAPTGTGALLAFGVLGAALVFRRRAYLALALLGCRTPASSAPDAAPAQSVVVPAGPPSPADRERIALEVLAGKVPTEGISEAIPYDTGLHARVQLGPTLPVDGMLPTARKTLSTFIPRVKLCYAKELEMEPNARGDLTLSMTVAADGSVADVTPVDEKFQPGFVSCVRRELAGAKFDAPGNKTTLKPTFQLSAE